MKIEEIQEVASAARESAIRTADEAMGIIASLWQVSYDICTRLESLEVAVNRQREVKRDDG